MEKIILFKKNLQYKYTMLAAEKQSKFIGNRVSQVLRSGIFSQRKVEVYIGRNVWLPPICGSICGSSEVFEIRETDAVQVEVSPVVVPCEGKEEMRHIFTLCAPCIEVRSSVRSKVSGSAARPVWGVQRTGRGICCILRMDAGVQGFVSRIPRTGIGVGLNRTRVIPRMGIG